MARLLTLAMSEFSPKNKNYIVIAYYIDRAEIIGINLMESKFKDINGSVVWDIGAVTKVEDIVIKDNGLYEVRGDMVLKEYYSKKELKDIFLRELYNYSAFIRERDCKYSIIKCQSILINIPENDNKGCFRTTISFWANGVEGKNKLNKDYRWLNYWKYIYSAREEEKIKNRINYYEEFFLKKEVYLILFRYSSENKKRMHSSRTYSISKDVHWVAGVHYF